jgi:hypothetical protein
VIRAGDHVAHAPTGETWVVAAMSPDGTELVCAGWPESIAPLSDCTLSRPCPDHQHVEMVQNCLKLGSYRASWSKAHTCPACVAAGGGR